ncbi:tripeptide aminopeptidase PepT [Bacteroides sp.]
MVSPLFPYGNVKQHKFLSAADSVLKAKIVAIPSPYDMQRRQVEKKKAFVITQDEMLARFLKYVKINSQSQEADVAGDFPMTDGQIEMAEYLEEEAKALGADVYRSEDAYVYITIPSNVKEKVPVLGISCHLDFTPEAPGGNITPIVERNYQGGDILLSNGQYLRVDSPEGSDLKNLIGKTIIHTDGTTLLGGDDKNGCAIAMSVVESVLRAGNKAKHGTIQIVFCPNEDVGLSAERIDTTRFNPGILFDLDGEGNSEVLSENFTARSLVLKFIGRYAHPGSAKQQKLGDALAAVSSFVAAVPLKYRPENTEGYEGYIHPWKVSADGNDYTVHSRIRYFDKEEGAEFKRILADNIERIKQDFPNVTVEIVQDILQYENVAYNMHPESHNIIVQAAKKAGVQIDFVKVRGGTTASMFTAKGLRGGMCLFTGQHAIHSVHEYSVLEEMYDSYYMMLHVVSLTARLKE